MITLRAVPGISAEIVLAVDGEWLKTRLLRSHEQAELVSAVADTRAMFVGRGGRDAGAQGGRAREGISRLQAVEP